VLRSPEGVAVSGKSGPRTHARENYTTDFSPWGGVRKSVLPDYVLSDKDGAYRLANVNFGKPGSMVNVVKTGGWAAAVQDAKMPTSQAFAWIFGTKRYGRVAVNGEKYRSKVSYGIRVIDQSSSGTIPLYLKIASGQKVLRASGSGRPAMYVYAQPVKDSKPLYLIKNLKTRRYHVTCDPYMLMKRVPIPKDTKGRTGIRPYDGSTEIVKIFGYVMPADKAASKLKYKRLDSILTDSSYFPGAGIYDSGVMVRTTPN